VVLGVRDDFEVEIAPRIRGAAPDRSGRVDAEHARVLAQHRDRTVEQRPVALVHDVEPTHAPTSCS
jgi:hypothetical protein